MVFAECNLPNCPRASIIQASERDFRVALVRDAVSRVTDSALTELAGIGVQILDTAALEGRLAGPATQPQRRAREPHRDSPARVSSE